MIVLKIDNLKKSFGDIEIIKDLSFSVPENSVYGFLGKNGAGKTTTMKMILGILKADEGSIEVCGEKVKYGETKTNRHIGFLPDVPEFYNYMSAKEYLKLCGNISSMENKIINHRTEELLNRVGLDGNKKKIGSFSRGMKQRLGIAQALLNKPKLLICDEPTSALDPIGRKEILDILLSIKEETTIIFSTHILSDVERICDNVAVLNKGILVLNGHLSELKNNKKEDIIQIHFDGKESLEIFKTHINSQDIAIGETIENQLNIICKDIKKNQKQIYNLFIEKNLYPIEIKVLDPTLESLFMEVVK